MESRGPEQKSSGDRVVVGMASRDRLELGVRLLERLRDDGVETHLVLTREATEALGQEAAAVKALASRVYAEANQAARISSGSFIVRGMVVAPCDAGALAAIVMGLATNLVFRAADVTLKERRPLVLGLAGDAPGHAEAESLERAAGIPGLAPLRLEGAVDDAVERLLAALDDGAAR